MRTGKNISLAVFLIMLLAACSKQSDVEFETTIVPVVSIEENTLQSKSAIIGTGFPSGSQFGIFICKHNQFTQYAERSNNVCATYITSENRCYYNYDNYSFQFSNLIFKSNSDNRYSDVYAYAPFKSKVTDLTAVPFDAAYQDDLMYAAENISGENKNIDMMSSASHPVNFRFKHSMALVEFSVKNNLPNTRVKLSQVWASTTGSGSTALYSKGTFNALTGQLAMDSTSPTYVKNTIQIAIDVFNNVFSDKRTSFYLLVPPVEVQGDDFVIGVVMNGVGGVGSGLNCVAIPRSDLMHSDGVTCGLQAGYRYKFSLDIDNYVHLSGVSIDNNWTEKNIDKDI